MNQENEIEVDKKNYSLKDDSISQYHKFYSQIGTQRV